MKRERTMIERVHRFVEEDVRPFVAKNGGDTYAPLLVSKMKELGLFGMNITKKYGGAELPISEISPVVAELSHGWVSLASILGSHMKVSGYVRDFGTPAQKDDLLSRLASGELVAAHGLTEENGKTLETLRTRIKKARGGWALSGTKPYVTHALHADIFAIVARADLGKKKRHVIALVPRGAKGCTLGPDMPRLGLCGLSVASVSLDRTPIHFARDVVGGGASAAEMAASAKIPELLHYAARAVGLSKAVIEDAAAHASAKKSGHRLLADIPLVRLRMAEMTERETVAEMVLAEAVRSAATDTGLLRAYVAKATATENAIDIARIGLSLAGARGYMKEAPFERYVRDAIGLSIIGTPTDVILDRIRDLSS